ncbi:MAG: sugar phosphate nucleotidyltransferase [Thermodesulfobacteriota bacterium]|nr:sugar phosphate nucleotidyltransferase [Thermodesulfobacteriota bacterium]
MAGKNPKVKAVIPAAGYGSRLHPFTLAVPKELLPVRRKPMIQMAVEEAIASGIQDVGVIIRKGKEVIRDYFDVLKTESRPSNKDHNSAVSLARAKLHFFFQEKPIGPGDAIYKAKDFIGDSCFVMIIPDQFVISNSPATAQLLDAAKEDMNAVWSSLVTVPPEELRFFTGARMLKLTNRSGNTWEVAGLCKETGYSNDMNSLGFGRTYFPSGLVEFFSKDYINPVSGEVDLLPSFEALIRGHRNCAALLAGKALDCGSWDGYEYFSVGDNGCERDMGKHVMWEMS